MRKTLKITFIGTGTSLGVPEIGCSCDVCTSPDTKNFRFRPSIFIECGNTSFIIDTTPDLRMQAIKFNINKIDAILYTHNHADHVFGLDDIRRYNHMQQKSIPCYGSEKTIEWIKRTFSYILEADKYKFFLPQVDFNVINGRFAVNGCEIIPINLMHSEMPVLGYRIGGCAYLTDCNKIPDESRVLLKKLDVLILDALRWRPHVAHFTLSEAIEEAEKIGAKKTYFTHISHDLDHRKTNEQLPENMELAYDGLVIEL